MSDETKCPKCGASTRPPYHHFVWLCGSETTTEGGLRFVQSARCRITQLEQQLSVAVEVLAPFATYWEQLLAAERHPGESVVPLPPWPEDYRAAAEALRQIGATP